MKKNEIIFFGSLFLVFLGPALGAKAATTPTQEGGSSMQWTSSSTSSTESNSSGEEIDPFHEMEKMEQSMNRIFQESLKRIRNYQHAGKFFEPDLDIEDKAEAYVLKMDLPGMEKENIHIDAVNNSLTISGQRTLERTEDSKAEGFYRTERSSGEFIRTVPMPSNANMDAITAKYHNGVLEITVPKVKSEPAPPSKPIAVQ